MRRPSADFIGTLIGLMIVLLGPGYDMDEERLFLYLIVFPGSGALIGTIIGKLRQRRP